MYTRRLNKKLHSVLAVVSLVCILVAVFVVPLSPTQAQTPSTSSTETRLASNQPELIGAFSHRWVAYVIEPSEGADDYYVELNGERLGPYSSVSLRFVFTPDGEHIAFAAEVNAQEWHIVVDGEDRYIHADLGWGRYSFSSSLDGMSFFPDMSAAVLQFSSSGEQIAYLVKQESDQWAIAVNGITGASFANVGINLAFINGVITHKAWIADNQVVLVQGDTTFGPYELLYGPVFSSDQQHFIMVGYDGNVYEIIVDGQASDLPGVLIDYTLGPQQSVAVSYQVGTAVHVSFNGVELPDSYDEVRHLAISPDGQHVAFWTRKGSAWSVVTDTMSYPGFNGYYYYQIGSESYAILWSADSQHLAYFARDHKLVLDGEITTPVNIPGMALQVYVDDKGTEVGLDLSQAPQLDRQAFVECLLVRAETGCDPVTSVLIGGSLARIETGQEGSFVFIGDQREGPYQVVEGSLLTSGDGRHHAYVVNTNQGQQIVLDGQLMELAYESIYRLQFIEEALVHLGLKAGDLYGVRYSFDD